MKKGNDNLIIPLKGNCANMSPTEFEKYTLFLLDNQFREKGIERLSIQHDKIKRGLDGNYQIDGTIEFYVMGVKYLVLVECKHYKNPVERKEILALHRKIDSIGAQKGIFVTSSSYQSGAIEYAKKHGIALLAVVEGKLNYYVRSKDVDERQIKIPLEPRLDSFKTAMITQKSNSEFSVSFVDKTDDLYRFLIEQDSKEMIKKLDI